MTAGIGEIKVVGIFNKWGSKNKISLHSLVVHLI